MRSAIERGVQKIVEDNGLRRGAGMPVEDRVREVTVDVREHLAHEVLAKLPGRVPQPVRMPVVAGEEEQPHVLEGVCRQNDRVRELCLWATQRVDVLHASRPAVGVGQDPSDPAMRPQVEIAGGQRFPHARQPGMPFVAGPGAEAIVPRGVRHLRVAVV